MSKPVAVAVQNPVKVELQKFEEEVITVGEAALQGAEKIVEEVAPVLESLGVSILENVIQEKTGVVVPAKLE